MKAKLAILIAVLAAAVLAPWLVQQDSGQAAPGGNTKPADAKSILRDVKAAPGFDVTLFAAPPDVRYPTCLACAPTGEVFVGIDENGSLDRKPGRGRVVRCTDSDGDGKADKFTEFCKVDSPRGLFYDNGSLYVLHPPDLSVFRDRDGDGVADESEVLVKGIGFGIESPRGADHTTNGIRLGIDGWIYVAVGDFGFTHAVGKDGKALQLHGGGVVRVRPDGTELELVSHGQRNIYDVAIDPFLNLFTRDNTNDGGGWDVRLSHVVPTGEYGYPSLFVHFPEEIIQPLADYGGGSPTGALFLDEPGFPAGFGNALYTCEWGRSAIFRHPLEPNGSTFKVKQESFVQLPRPTDMDVDGQGRIYISSWRNGGFTYGGPDVGYVIRVTHPDNKPAPFPDLKKATVAELLKHLTSPSQVCRLYTQREILRRGEQPGLADGLEKLALSDAPPAGRAAALFTLKQLLGERAVEPLVRLAKHAELRELALRLLADRRGETAGVPTALFEGGLKDANPRVRLQAAIGLGRLGKREAAAKLLPVTADADPVVAHVAVKALVALRAVDDSLKALDQATPKLIPGAAFVRQSLHEPAVVEGLIQRLEASKDTAVREGALKALCRLYQKEAEWDGKWWGTRPDTTGPYFKPVTWGESPKIAQVLQQTLKSADAATARFLLLEMARNRVDLADTTALVLKMAGDNADFRPTAVDLLTRRSPLAPASLKFLEELASSPKEEASLRVKALRGLAGAPKQPEALDAAVRVLSAVRPDADALPLVVAWDEFTRDGKHAQNAGYFVKLTEAEDAGRRELGYAVLLRINTVKNAPKNAKAAAEKALETGWGKKDSAAALLHAIARTRLKEYTAEVKLHLADARPEVRQAADEAARELGLTARTTDDRPLIKGLRYEKVLAAAVKDKGDPKLGEKLFVKQGCVNCHTISAKEPPKGPFLGDIKARYSRAELVESVLKPSAKIAQGFDTQFFVMTDGRILEGFVTRESGDEVELRNITGTALVLAKKDIDERGRRPLSTMPTGLADELTVHELSSVLAFIESLKSR